MKVAMLLSGGVDSSVALRLVKSAGHDVTAFYIKIWLEDELRHLGDCPWEEDVRYARAVCEQLKVPFESISLQKEYWDTIVAYTLRELRAGRTPNPDVLCNERIKFGIFFEKISGGFEKIASGHYADIGSTNGFCYLKQSPDSVKDQTYFLSSLRQEQLRRILFPIGRYTKKQVREMAREWQLPTKDRKDSQGICFLGQVRFSEFIKHHLGEKIGDIIDKTTGAKLGEHNGYWYFTIGQRHGIRLGGGPWYVVKKDIKRNIIYVDRRELLPRSERASFSVEETNWIPKLPREKNVGVRIRHTGAIHPAEINATQTDGTVRLKKPLFDLAAGQFAAFYKNQRCLGGGVIMI